MEFSPTPLPGAFLIRIKNIVDNRGHFGRAWCQEEFKRAGLNPALVQINTAFSHARGTLRGLHFQLAPHAEVKVARCTAGAIWDVIVDLRKDSPTYLRSFGAELSAANGTMLYVPEGFAHGYQTLTDNAEMYYLTSQFYAPAAARGVRYDDPAFGISWPLPVSVVSDADKSWPLVS